MIEKLLHNAHLLHQSADAETTAAESPIAVCSDSDGIIVISQDGLLININRASVWELCKLLKEMSRETENPGGNQ